MGGMESVCCKRWSKVADTYTRIRSKMYIFFFCPSHRGVWGIRDTAPVILNLGAKWR
jgi:hypothetical protein